MRYIKYILVIICTLVFYINTNQTTYAKDMVNDINDTYKEIIDYAFLDSEIVTITDTKGNDIKDRFIEDMWIQYEQKNYENIYNYLFENNWSLSVYKYQNDSNLYNSVKDYNLLNTTGYKNFHILTPQSKNGHVNGLWTLNQVGTLSYNLSNGQVINGSFYAYVTNYDFNHWIPTFDNFSNTVNLKTYYIECNTTYRVQYQYDSSTEKISFGNFTVKNLVHGMATR